MDFKSGQKDYKSGQGLQIGAKPGSDYKSVQNTIKNSLVTTDRSAEYMQIFPFLKFVIQDTFKHF